MNTRPASSMLRIAPVVALSILASLTAGPQPCAAVEPATAPREAWSDPRLPEIPGLLLWLDASRQEAARASRGLPPLRRGGPLDMWLDASGRRRDVVQPQREARPAFRTAPAGPLAGAAVRFDGAGDFLAFAGPERQTVAFTVFIVAAPRANPGWFRAFLAANRAGANDYTSGFTVDQTGAGSERFDRLSVEGAGFGGSVDLLRDAFPFGAFRRIAARSDGSRVELFADGAAQGARERDPLPVRLDGITVGARVYSNEADPPFVQGHLDGDIAEVILYGRSLDDAEMAQVDGYLRAKHATVLSLASSDALETLHAAGASVPLEVRPPGAPGGPLIEVLVPGFEAVELPLRLTNVNNLRYRDDGVLVALGYDGRIHLLADTDGDGVEDRAETFWEGDLRGPIGMALTPPGYPRGRGAFIASKGKVSLIADTDGDDRADEEVIVASGWEELPHGVDALGVALADDGGVWFGLGCTDFTNAYLVDRRTGVSRYSLESERGTVLRVSPDFSSREVVCTGIRFPVGLVFNRRGDLFATDQEGATWLPGGNPLDELLHIVPGRHYGFPPRHERFLPDVIDEPSVFDYGPQHQSTCGLAFNEPSPGRLRFGPPSWEGDALVAGYSRGKLYRTELHRTEAGYVARTRIIACAGMLPVDVAVSRAGRLVIACHSGGPDWGSGPQGEGRIFQVRHADPGAPQPVAVWAEGPLETRVAFDRPLDSAVEDLRVEITYGDFVRAGDRFEVLRPGYQVVAEETRAPRHALAVDEVRLSPDRRAIVLGTRPHPARCRYALRIEGLASDGAVELDYALDGVEARWEPSAAEGAGAGAWSGWLPHLDTGASLAFLDGSSRTERLAKLLAMPGTLTLRARLALPPGDTNLRVYGPPPLRARAGEVERAGERGDLSIEVSSSGQPIPFAVSFATGTAGELRIERSTARDPTRRRIPGERLLLPWAPERTVAEITGAALIAETAADLPSGDWLLGRDVFFGAGRCATCHTLRGLGRGKAPDLSNLVHRDAASVRRDIERPSAAIHPDFAAYEMVLRTGEALSGVPRSAPGGALSVLQPSGEERVVERDQVVEFRPSALSVMPEGLVEAIGESAMDDLLTFLLAPPPSMPADRDGAPGARTLAEVDAALGVTRGAAAGETIDAAKGADPAAPARPLRIVLVAGPKDHGPGEHDYPAWQDAWKRLLDLAPGVTARTAWEWPEAADLAAADVLVLYQRGEWSARRAADLDAFLARGGGAVFIHYAVDGGSDPQGLAARIGLAWQGGRSRFRHGPLALDLSAAGDHPIARGLDTLELHDESYWTLIGDPSRVRVIATGIEDGAPRPLVWTREAGAGRVFVSIPGHFSWTFDDPLFRVLLLRGIAWAAGEPADRLDELATPGARVVEGSGPAE